MSSVESKWLSWMSVPRDETIILALMKSGDVYATYFADGCWWLINDDGEYFGDESGMGWLPYPEATSDWFIELLRVVRLETKTRRDAQEKARVALEPKP